MGQGDSHGFWVVLAGLLVLVVIFVFAANQWSDVKDVVAAMGAVTGTIGTIVGAYFGVKVGESDRKAIAKGRDDAQAENRQLHEKIAHLAAAAPPEIASRILEKH
jgi:hypothetical protein